MSRGQDFSAFNARVRSALEADISPVDDEPCGVDAPVIVVTIGAGLAGVGRRGQEVLLIVDV